MKRLLATFLAVLTVLSSLVLLPSSAISPVSISVPTIEIEAGTKYVDIPVSISNIPSVGLGSFLFNLKAGGLLITNIDSMLNGISPIGPIADSDKKGATFMWSDLIGIRNDMQVCTYTVRIPDTATGGDVFPIVITPGTGASDFASVDADPATGKSYGLGATAVNGQIIIVGEKSKYPPVSVKAPTVEVEAGTDHVHVPISISNIPSLGLGSFKFNTTVAGFEVTDAAFGPIPGEPRIDSPDLSATRGVDIIWTAPSSDAIFDSTTVVTYTFKIPKSARPGDEYPIVITPDTDRSNFITFQKDHELGDTVYVGADAVNGKIVITGENVPDPVQPDPVTLKAPEIRVSADAKSVDIPVTAGDIPREGLAGCSFNLKVDGLSITGIRSDLKGQCDIPGSFVDSASKGADFAWRGTDGISMTTELCTYTVELPASAKAGDVFPIIITPNADPAAFPSASVDPASGSPYALGAVCVNGQIVITAHEHELAAVQSKTATCTDSGIIACFRCTVCQKYFSDAAAQKEIPAAQTVIPPLGHSWGEWSTVSASTCQTQGSALRRCTNNSDHTETKVLPLAEHRFTHIEGKVPSCESGGMREYQRCEDCRQCFTVLSSVTYPDNPKTNGEVVVKTPSFTVPEGTREMKIPILLSGIDSRGLMSCIFRVNISGGATITAVEENDAALTGNLQPGQIISDENGCSIGLAWVAPRGSGIHEETVAMTLTVSLPANTSVGDRFAIQVSVRNDPDDFMTIGTEIGIGAVAVSGSIEIAGQTALDENKMVLEPLGHDLEFVKAKGPTEKTSGNIAHYRCRRCGKLYADSDATKELTHKSVYGLLGDANGDGTVNARDITAIMRVLLGQKPASYFPTYADANCDGTINARDITTIMRMLLNKK